MDNPYPHLCLNIPAPKSDPFDLAFPTSRDLYFLFGTKNKKYGWGSFPAKDRPELLETADRFAKAEFEEWMQNQALSDTSFDLNQSCPYKSETAIDNKSFAQQFFSTSAWNRQPLTEESRGSSYEILKPFRPEHLHCALNSADSVLDCVFAELGNINESTRPKSLLFGGEVGMRVSERTYFRDLSKIVERADQYSPMTEIGRKRGIVIDRAKVFKTLPDPSRLMLYGLSPLPNTNISSWLDSSASISTTCSGLQFFCSRTSQNLHVIYLEIMALSMCGQIDPHDILEGLVSSVKFTNFDPELKRSMPSSIASHIMAISISALLTTVDVLREDRDEILWNIFEDFRGKGHILFDGYDIPKNFKMPPGRMAGIQSILDRWALAYEEPVAQYLMKLILRSFASWSYTSTISKLEDGKETTPKCAIQDERSDFKTRVKAFLTILPAADEDLTRHLNWRLLEWARTIFLRDWNGEAKFQWNTDVGASIEFMRWMYSCRDDFGLEPGRFVIDVLINRLDYLEACKDWMEFGSTNLTGNLLDFSWLFSSNAKVTMFRTINLCHMFSAYEASAITADLVARMTLHTNSSARQLLDRLSISMDMFLLIDIRRDNILRDAFNQLWRRQKRELFRPLKVRMGMDEGEEGVDMGGVQQEFFRLAIADATDPAKGLFSIDERTRMTWFQPMSLAPLHQFTLLGLLFGLALYNGITLAITFPLAFYRKLLGTENTSIQDIEDGWPDLHNGLLSLLTWSDDQVEETFLRTYTFSFESLGIVHDVDMHAIGREEKWPIEHPKVAEEPIMVSNDNRKKYVSDYIFWLTNKSIGPQFKAFMDGFYLPLRRKALHLLKPEDLRSLLEGHQAIDIEELKQTAQYEDGYSRFHKKIIEFWEVVQDLSPEQHVKLLEFVTASPRVPVRGMVEVTFIIQRNGIGDERLPSSLTCFGRLLLPEYSSKQVMAEKLKLAIQNNTGFGTQ